VVDNFCAKRENVCQIMPEFVENFVTTHTKKAKKNMILFILTIGMGDMQVICWQKCWIFRTLYTPHSLGKLKKIEMQEQIEEMPLNS